MTVSQALVGEAFTPRERARYQGYLVAVAMCVNTFGPVAGGEHFGWQAVFLINVPIGLLASAGQVELAAGLGGAVVVLRSRPTRLTT
jgi:MFS family permease